MNLCDYWVLFYLDNICACCWRLANTIINNNDNNNNWVRSARGKCKRSLVCHYVLINRCNCASHVDAVRTWKANKTAANRLRFFVFIPPPSFTVICMLRATQCVLNSRIIQAFQKIYISFRGNPIAYGDNDTADTMPVCLLIYWSIQIGAENFAFIFISMCSLLVCRWCSSSQSSIKIELRIILRSPFLSLFSSSSHLHIHTHARTPPNANRL